MLSPKKIKWRRQHKGRRKGYATRGNTVAFGDYGIQAQGDVWMTARQIEASRIAISRSVKRGGKIWNSGFPPQNPSVKNRLKFVWVRERGVRSTGLLLSDREWCFLKSME